MSSGEVQQQDLNGFSGFLLAVFIVVSFFVIWPVYIPISAVIQRPLLNISRRCRIIDQQEYKTVSAKSIHFPLSLETAPVIGVIILLATTTIHGSTIKLGIKGDEYVKPYDVLVLFISLAYISIALDGTGALEALAFWVSQRGGSSGRRLFLYLYGFFLSAGCIVGNDPLILSGTPFLAYLTAHTGLNPTPWVFSEFMAANTASAVLVSSNPTNILITGSFSLNYITDFTKWTVLPSLIPAILTYPILLVMFRNSIPKTLTPLQDDPWTKLRDKTGAIFFGVLMLTTLAVLVGTTFVPGGAVEVWMVTAPAGILAFAFEVVRDSTDPRRQSKIDEKKVEDQAAETDNPEKRVSTRPQSEETITEATNLSNTTPTSEITETKCVTTPIPMGKANNSSKDTPHLTFTSLLHSLAHRFPTTTRTVTRLPIPLLPFATCEFIMVRGLAQRGWITVFARGFANACTTPARAVFFMGYVSAAFLCPLAGTNIGATIMLVEIMRDPAFSQSPAILADNRILLGSIYAVAMGSNLGAFSYTFAGSLAGLLWRNLLGQKGVEISQLKFAMVNAVPLLVQTTVAYAIILGQLYWFA